MKNSLKNYMLLFVCLLLSAIMTGCGDEDPEAFVTEQLEHAVAGDEQVTELMLSQGLEELEGKYVLDFPDELKKTYCDFLTDACQSIQYKIVECEKHNKGYKVNIELTPVDVADTMEECSEAYILNLETTDLCEAVETLLLQNQELLDDPEEGRTELVTLYMKEGKDGFVFDEGEWEQCVSVMLTDYMEPYENVADVLNSRDYLIATLDAIYKGDVARYARHMGLTEEEAFQEYEKSFTTVDLTGTEMTEEQKSRFMDSMKTMFANSQYEVGAAKKSEDEGYWIQMTVTPNLSLQKSGAEFNKNVRNRRYGSTEAVKEGYLQILEKYADSPVYDETLTLDFHMPAGNLLYNTNGENEFEELGELIMPSVE